MKPKIYDTAREIVADIKDGATLFVGGFGPIGYPFNLMQALFDQGTKDLTFISNAGASFGKRGPIDFLHFYSEGRVKKMINIGCGGSHPSRPNTLEKLILSGELEGETLPQGTLAERIRAAGAGIPAFYTPVGVGTEIAEGKEYREFDGRGYILERALHADYALVHAWKADQHGNMIFRRAARNFNPIMTQAADISIAEIEEPIVPSGDLDPDEIHAAGVFLHRMLPIPEDGMKKINLREWREKLLTESQMAKRAAAKAREKVGVEGAKS